LIALNTIILLALAEGVARLAEWVHPAGDAVTFAYSPYRMLKMSQAPWPLNRDGFRARELETYHDSFLIEFLGGSVCLGVGDDPGATVPERLEAALHQAGLARVMVLNLCQGGAASAEELAIFVEYGLPLHPQVVLSFDGANDVLHPRPVGDDNAPNLPYLNAQLEARVNRQDGVSHIALARVAARMAARFAAPAPAQSPPVPESAILDSYLYHLAAVRTLAEADHCFYAVLFQPTLHLDKPWSAEETAMWNPRRPRDAAPLTRLIRERYGHAREAAAQWADDEGVALYDLSSTFSNINQTVYSDSVHFRGSSGYELLFAQLERSGLIARIRARYREWETGL
jgi:lysophospholipase L1-like esterase